MGFQKLELQVLHTLVLRFNFFLKVLYLLFELRSGRGFLLKECGFLLGFFPEMRYLLALLIAFRFCLLKFVRKLLVLLLKILILNLLILNSPLQQLILLLQTLQFLRKIDGNLIFVCRISGVLAHVSQFTHEFGHVPLTLLLSHLNGFKFALLLLHLLFHESHLNLVACSLQDFALHQFYGCLGEDRDFLYLDLFNY